MNKFKEKLFFTIEKSVNNYEMDRVRKSMNAIVNR